MSEEQRPLRVHDWMPAWVSLVHAGTALSTGLDAHLREHLGISLAEQDLLKQLDLNGGALPLGELSRRLYFSKAGMTKMVDRLERAGLVARMRSDSDRRSVQASLTSAGDETLRSSRERMLAWIWEHFRAHLDDQQIVALRDVLAALLKGMDRYEGQLAHLRGASHST